MYTQNSNPQRPITVSQLNSVVNSVLSNEPVLRSVLVEGQLSNVKIYSSGHMYFTLKDAKASVDGIMYRSNVERLRRMGFTPQENMKVICRGSVGLYEAGGKYQIQAVDMQPDGIGALAVALEQLKQRLHAQGLFSPDAKKPIPAIPKTVGVITSPTGAVIQDIKKVLYKRFPLVDMVFYPVAVQGAEAPPQLIKALKELDQSGVCDVIIIGRGGGSMEDLWAFNDEGLAYAVYQCETPVISAVGHQTDFTICDMVADLRAATPSEAAEHAVPDIRDLKSYYLGAARFAQKVMQNRFSALSGELAAKQNRLNYLSPQARLTRLEDKYKGIAHSLRAYSAEKINSAETAVKAQAAKLEGLNPLAVLSRGYALAEQEEKIITKVSGLNREKPFTVTFSDGKIEVKATGE